MRRISAAAIVSLLASGAHADPGTFTPPDGCTAFLTVQSNSCRVTHYYGCNSAAGDVWAAYFNAQGLQSIVHEDAETARISQTNETTGAVFTTLPDAADPASLTTLLATGSDEWTYDQDIGDGLQVRHSGVDQLTGERVTIDGEELQLVSSSYQTRAMPEDVVLVTGTATQMILGRLRLALQATEHRTSTSSDWTRDTTPVQFLFPGDQGFLSNLPITGCDAQLGALPIRRTQG
ncbi:MAG: hypothetical protein KDK12_06905 [Rhodobacteraceae bacterium]|nr:hypothetical protein [Paracoccaceae bacterium]